MADTNDPFADVTLAGSEDGAPDPFADIEVATDEEAETQATIDAELEKARQAALNAMKDSKPFTGEEDSTMGGYFDPKDATLGLINIDRMETPITEDEKKNPIIVNVVESDEYQNATDSITRNMMLERAITEANMNRFRDYGEPSLGGPGTFLGDTFGVETRTQVFDTPDGQRTYIVPKPGAESTGFQRTLMGGLLRGAQETGAFVEDYLVDPFLGGDPSSNSVRENFPIYPAASGLEEVGQEITSIVAGGATGAGIVAKLDKVVKLSPKMAKYVSKMWDEAKQANPDNFKQGMELFLKGVLIERGANLGATVTTPDTAEPLVGDNVLEMFGADPEENKNLAHYIDNEVFSFGINVLAKSFKGAKYLTSKFVPKGAGSEARRQRELGMIILKEIDPTITDDTPLNEIARRAYELGAVMAENSSFTTNLVKDGAEISLDSGSAIMLGAENYFRRTMAWREPIIGKEAFEAEVKEQAADMANRIVAMKQSRSNAPIVNQADSMINAQVTSTLRTAGDEALPGGVAAADDLATAEASRIVTDVSDARSLLDTATVNADIAEAQAKAVRDRDRIVTILDGTRDKNAIGSTAAERQTFSMLTGEDLYKSWRQSYDNYNEAFKALPDDAPIDTKSFIEDFNDIFKTDNSIDFITSTATKQDPIADIVKGFKPQQKLDDAGELMFTGKGANKKPVMETMDDVVARLEGEGLSLKFLYTKVRPALSGRITTLRADKNPAANLLVQLKGVIDDMATQSGDEAFVNAKNVYADHESVWGSTSALSAWEDSARGVSAQIDEAGNIIPSTTAEGKDVVTATGRPVGLPDTLSQGYMLLKQAEADPSGVQMEELLEALRVASGPGTDMNLANAYGGLAMKALLNMSEAGKPITADQVRTALQPYIQQLESTDAGRGILSSFDQTIKDLEAVDAGLLTAKEVLETNQANYDQVIRNAQMDAASIFVSDLTGNTAVRANPSAAFDELLKSKNAPDQIKRMLENPNTNPLIRDGIKAHFFNYVADQIGTAKRLGADPLEGGAGSVNEMSAAKLDRILGQRGGDNTLVVAKELFADDPEMYQNLVDLLQVQNIALNNRAYRPGNFGSNTAQNIDNRQKVDRLIVLTLGVLNPTATKARNIGRVFTEMSDRQAQELYMTTFDMMMANPNYMKEAFDLVGKEHTQEDLIALTSRYFTKGALGAYKDRNTDLTRDAIPLQ